MKIDRESMIADFDNLLKKMDLYIAAIVKFRSEIPDARELLPEGTEDTDGYYLHYFNITSFINALEEGAMYSGFEL